MDHAVDEQRPDRDVRIAIQQIEQDRRDDHAAKQGRGRNRDHAARCRVNPRRVPVRLLDLGQDAPAVGEIPLPGLGQPYGTGGAVQQAGAEPRFQSGDRPRDRGRRQVEAPGRGRKTGFLGHGDEDGHGLQAVHGLLLALE
jgi:hypothetical protein